MSLKGFFVKVSLSFLLVYSCTFEMGNATILNHIPADTETSQRRRKSVLILVLKTPQICLKWKSWRPFFKTSSRHLPGDALKMSSRRRPQDIFRETSSKPPPGDVLKTSLRRLKTSRLFLVRAKDHLEAIYSLSIYVRFKLLTYYHSVTRQSN